MFYILVAQWNLNLWLEGSYLTIPDIRIYYDFFGCLFVVHDHRSGHVSNDIWWLVIKVSSFYGITIYHPRSSNEGKLIMKCIPLILHYMLLESRYMIVLNDVLQTFVTNSTNLTNKFNLIKYLHWYGLRYKNMTMVWYHLYKKGRIACDIRKGSKRFRPRYFLFLFLWCRWLFQK